MKVVRFGCSQDKVAMQVVLLQRDSSDTHTNARAFRQTLGQRLIWLFELFSMNVPSIKGSHGKTTSRLIVGSSICASFFIECNKSVQTRFVVAFSRELGALTLCTDLPTRVFRTSLTWDAPSWGAPADVLYWFTGACFRPAQHWHEVHHHEVHRCTIHHPELLHGRVSRPSPVRGNRIIQSDWKYYTYRRHEYLFDAPVIC